MQDLKDAFVTCELNRERAADLLNTIIVPRPIAFVTSIGTDGVVNAAPFSYFNAVCGDPPLVSIAIQRRKGQLKDTSRNIAANRQFVINICSLGLEKAVSIAGGDFPPDVSEVTLAKLDLVPSVRVAPPRIANTLAQLECELHQMFVVGHQQADLVIGEVKILHLHRDILTESGDVDVAKLNPLARLGGSAYAKVETYCHLPRGL
jgi:flavin reductase (DIM6/NTAB) family NADH-FMN oxidoreductase RutF